MRERRSSLHPQYEITHATVGYVYNVIPTRLLIILCNNIVFTITTALYAGSVYHVLHQYRAYLVKRDSPPAVKPTPVLIEKPDLLPVNF